MFLIDGSRHVKIGKLKIGKFSDNKQIFNSEIVNVYSMHICNFRTQYVAGTNCQRRLLAAFRVLSCIFVSLLCLPHAFFGVHLLIIKHSDIQQVTSSRLDKFENISELL